jgi:hypothetical protein
MKTYFKAASVFVFGAACIALSCAQSSTLNPAPDGATTGSGNKPGATAAGGTSVSSAGGSGNTGNVVDAAGIADSGPADTGTGTVGVGGSSGGGLDAATGGTADGGGTGGHAATGGGSGAAGRSGTGGAGGSAATFAQVTALFAANCVSCHDGTSHTDLRASGLYARIVSQPATKSAVATCKTQDLIVPNDTGKSLISNKVKGPPSLTGCGVRMPYDCSTTSTNPRACLTTAQINIIDSWITAGAPM